MSGRSARSRAYKRKQYPVVAVHASERALDLAIIKIEARELPANFKKLLWNSNKLAYFVQMNRWSSQTSAMPIWKLAILLNRSKCFANV